MRAALLTAVVGIPMYVPYTMAKSLVESKG